MCSAGVLTCNVLIRTCLYARRPLVQAATDTKGTRLSRLTRLFGDIFRTEHAHEVPFCPSNASLGRTNLVVDAQGAMLVLERIKHLVRKGVVKANCDERVRLIANTIKSMYQNGDIGDTSLAGFDAVSRLADIEKEHLNSRAEGFPEELLMTDLARMCVEGLDGVNTISRLVSDCKLQVLVR